MSWRSWLFLSLLSLNFLTLPVSAAPGDPKLRVIYAIDSLSGQVGADLSDACTKMRVEMEKIFAEIFVDDDDHKWADRFESELITDDDLTPDELKRFIRSREVGANDTLFVYYCGHGVVKKTDAGDRHYFAMAHGDIERAEVRTAMNDTGARLRVLISDTCTSRTDSDPEIPERQNPAKWKPFENLMFKHKGVVDFTAASFGEFAWFTGDGGIFSRCFIRLFCEGPDVLDFDKNKKVTWKEFYYYSMLHTQKAFENAKEGAPAGSQIKDSKTQSPSRWELGEQIE